MATLLCRVVWAKEYRSKKEKFFAGNMMYPARTKIAHELLNFFDKKGFVYGFVENNRKKINLEKIGASPKASAFAGVTVILCALDQTTRRLRVVGWYDNATVFSEPQSLRSAIRGDWKYQFKVAVADAHLIPEADRFLEVPMKPTVTDTGYIGQTNWFFPEQSRHYDKFLQAFALLRAGTEPTVVRPASEVERRAFEEGQRATVEINVTIRNPKLVAAAKKHYGYRCQVCDFSFEERYGAIGNEFIEVHHLVPVSSLSGPRQLTVEDVRVVCANCHRMIHRREKPLDLSELKKMLR